MSINNNELFLLRIIEWVNDNKISNDKIPRDVNILRDLNTIDLSNCNLKEISREFSFLKNITSLSLENNNLISLPKEIINLNKLEKLNIQNNNIELNNMQKIWLKRLEEKGCIILEGFEEIAKIDEVVTVDIPVVFYNFGAKKRSLILSGELNKENTTLDFNTSEKKFRLIVKQSKFPLCTEANNIVSLSFKKNKLIAVLLVQKLQNYKIQQVSIDVNLGSKKIIRSIEEFMYDKLEDEYDLKMFECEDSKLSKELYQENISIIRKSTQLAIVELMESISTTVRIENLHTPEVKSINCIFEFTREEFDDEIIEVRRKVIDIVSELLSRNNLYAADIETVVMLGENSKIPSIYSSIKDTFGLEPKVNIDADIVLFKQIVI